MSASLEQSPTSKERPQTALPLSGDPAEAPIPMYNHDGSVMLDHRGQIVHRNKFLSTHPLKKDVKDRVGYGGNRMQYLSGECVIRTMNTVFGHAGWSTEVTMEKLVQCEKDEKGRWVVGYLVRVKLSLLNGVSHEDCGSGEGINDSKIKSHEKAMKSAITDAMKRAARHLGERLGNALYVKGSVIKNAPLDNKKAIEDLERKEALTMFGEQHQLQKKFLINREPSCVHGKDANSKIMNNKSNERMTNSFVSDGVKSNTKITSVRNEEKLENDAGRIKPTNPYRRPLPQSIQHSHQNPNLSPQVRSEGNFNFASNDQKRLEQNKYSSSAENGPNFESLERQYQLNPQPCDKSLSNHRVVVSPPYKMSTAGASSFPTGNMHHHNMHDSTSSTLQNTYSHGHNDSAIHIMRLANQVSTNHIDSPYKPDDRKSPSVSTSVAPNAIINKSTKDHLQRTDLDSLKNNLIGSYNNLSNFQQNAQGLKRLLPTESGVNDAGSNLHVQKRMVLNPYNRT